MSRLRLAILLLCTWCVVSARGEAPVTLDLAFAQHDPDLPPHVVRWAWDIEIGFRPHCVVPCDPAPGEMPDYWWDQVEVTVPGAWRDEGSCTVFEVDGTGLWLGQCRGDAHGGPSCAPTDAWIQYEPDAAAATLVTSVRPARCPVYSRPFGEPPGHFVLHWGFMPPGGPPEREPLEGRLEHVLIRVLAAVVWDRVRDIGDFGLIEFWVVPQDWQLGDVQFDGDVDLADLAQLLAHYGETDWDLGPARGDLDFDGDVDLDDLGLLLRALP